MSDENRIPSFRWYAVVLAMLSLSIGWGIRGNFGHEFGAMVPGALCAIAVCLASGREDWRRRVFFFALFGSIGWGFGGSMSYMQVVGYTQSGHLPSQIYGFFGVFALGFLWASMGGAGTAYGAVESRERMTAILKPLAFVIVLWGFYYVVMDDLDTWYSWLVMGSDRGDLVWHRQNSPFYWLDTDWKQALLAIVAVCLFDIWDRWSSREDHGPAWVAEAFLLVLLPIVGAVVGWAVQSYLARTGMLDTILGHIVKPMGDVHAPITGEDGAPLALTPSDFLYNWPQVFFDLGAHMGWLLGAVAGIVLYFIVFGKWRSGSSLILHMSLGWFVAFLAMPVLLSPLFPEVGGFRMTPPRGDNWSGVVGVLAGTMIYMWRNGLVAVNLAAIVSGVIGGLGLMFTQFLKMMCLAVGNPKLVDDPSIVAFWQHWQGANWHSLIIEQGVGLTYGLAIAVALGLLATRTPRMSGEPPVRRWAEVYAMGFLLCLLLYVNIVKNVEEFTQDRTPNIPGVAAAVSNPAAFEADQAEDSNGKKREPGDAVPAYRCVPEHMSMPLIKSINLSAMTWFTLTFLLMSVCIVALGLAHLSKPLALVPASWVGRGQILYLGILWAMVVANFERALPGFTEQRLCTEWVIFVNAIVATFLIVYYMRDTDIAPEPQAPRYLSLFAKTVAGGLLALLISVAVYTGGARVVWGDESTSVNRRLGDQADWYIKPILRTQKHR